MKQKVLVAYATRHETTTEVAQVIASELGCREKIAHVSLIEGVGSIRPYQAVVVGSAIRYRTWLPEALQFLRVHRAALRRIPVAVFTHIQATSDSEEDCRQREAYLDDVQAVLHPQFEAWFSGRLDPVGLSAEERRTCPLPNLSSAMDLRDWDTIRAWARRIL